MVDQNQKPEDAETGPENEVKDMDEKSINELLKEYAEDVKDKDLDDFLKDSGDAEGDVFEGDDSDVAPVVAAPKKKSGFVTFLLFLILCGAAGAGAWMYLTKDEGMTNVMGGFGGSDASTVSMDTPPLPDAQPVMPGADVLPATEPVAEIASPFPEDAGVPGADVPAPTPIMNETTDASAPADLLAETTIPAPDTSAAAPVTVTTETAPVPATDVAPADASQAVNDWMSSASDGMAETEAKLDAAATTSTTPTPAPELAAAPAADEPAVDIAEVNAKPVDKTPEPKTDAPAEPKAARASSPYDEALPPPYVAIKAGKGESVAKAADAPAASAARMTPVVEGGASASAEPTYKRGSTAATEPAETRATGVYKDLVKQGGGAIDLPGLTANVKNDITIGQAQTTRPVANPAVSMPVDSGPVRLAIQGGKSLPPEMTARTATGTVTAKLPAALAADAEPSVPAVPVEAVESEPEAVTSAPAAEAEAPVSAPAADEAPAGDGPSGELRATINQALTAEKAGDAAKAISLYQKALELDAVQGGGLDRGMVYDRIGALRSQ